MKHTIQKIALSLNFLYSIQPGNVSYVRKGYKGLYEKNEKCNVVSVVFLIFEWLC